MTTDITSREHTLVGVQRLHRAPASAPAVRRPIRLPELDTCGNSAIVDLAANCLASEPDRDAMLASDRHVSAVLQEVGRLDALATDQWSALQQQDRQLAEQLEQILTLQRELAIATGAAEAYSKALRREQEALSDAARECVRLEELNARRAAETQRARDCVRSMSHSLADALADLSARELADAFDVASRTIVGLPTAELSVMLAPADDPFGEPDLTRVWPHGTNPDTIVVDVDRRGAR